jgi:thiamine biosynthesis lipoprotein
MRAAALAATLALAACSHAPEPQTENLTVFGAEATLALRGATPSQAHEAAASVASHLDRFGRDWHPWQPGALVDINAAFARGESAPAPASIRDLVERSQTLAPRTEGLFDPAVGGLLQLWGFHTSQFPVTTPAPNDAQINAWLAGHASIAQVRTEGERIASNNRAVQLDFGGLAEGMAAEETARVLDQHGVHDALLALGDDLYAHGQGAPWPAEIRDPWGGVFATAQLQAPEALFTTGNYNKFREAPTGSRWPHVLDPRTGRPARGTAAVVVIHRDPVLADIAVTSLMVGGPARFAELVQRLDLHCALLLTEENELMITAAMEARLTLQRQPVRLGAPLGTPGPCTR